MKCNFCHKETEKLCDAHIVPESFFRFLYPGGKVEGDSIIMVTENSEHTKRKRIGFYDSTILCKECDKVLGKKFDQYGKEIFIDREPEFIQDVDAKFLLSFKDVDISRLKLFLLSVLWRFSISTLPELRGIKLPDYFENKLRKMIIDHDAGGLNDFSIVMTRFDYSQSNKIYHKYFQLPVKTRINSVNYLNIYLPNGYKILIKIDSRSQVEDLIPITLDYNKPAYVLVYEHFEKTNEFKKLLENAYKVKKKV